MNDEERGKPRQEKRDFWHAWRQERHRLWEEMSSPMGGPHHGPFFPPGKRARYWREFFHERMGAWPEDLTSPFRNCENATGLPHDSPSSASGTGWPGTV